MKTITKALLNVQSSITAISKNKKNEHFGYTYVEINAILEHILPVLTENKLFLHQTHSVDEFGNFITHTILLHESGESIKNEVPLRVSKQDPQSMGGLCTYGRRYGLVSLLGLQAVDDDCHSAMEWRTEEQKAEYQKLLQDPFFKGKYNETNNWFKDFKTKDETQKALDIMKQRLSDHYVETEKKLDEEMSDLDNQLKNKTEVE